MDQLLAPLIPSSILLLANITIPPMTTKDPQNILHKKMKPKKSCDIYCLTLEHLSECGTSSQTIILEIISNIPMCPALLVLRSDVAHHPQCTKERRSQCIAQDPRGGSLWLHRLGSSWTSTWNHLLRQYSGWCRVKTSWVSPQACPASYWDISQLSVQKNCGFLGS